MSSHIYFEAKTSQSTYEWNLLTNNNKIWNAYFLVWWAKTTKHEIKPKKQKSETKYM